MKIALFTSGHVRTLFYKFNENISLIKKKVSGSKVDVFYSFWDDFSRSDRINDPWHYRAEYIQPNVSIDSINLYLIEGGASRAVGEIESSDEMKNVMERSPFVQPHLSSQYYKKNRVVEKYYNNNYDFYVQIRSDITIGDFPTMETINEIVDKNYTIINKNYWYMQPYIGMDCNEMIICSGKNIFKQINQLHLHEEKLSKQILMKNHHGEMVTGKYLNNMLSSGIIDTMLSFDFDYRVVR
jgi:hypothetical protein